MSIRKFVTPLLLAAVLILHVGLSLYNLPLRLVFSGQPVTSFDYDTHVGQTVHTVQALKEFGKSWAWDPSLNAGFPNGTIFDADNKGLELFVYLLGLLGVSLITAFNLFVLIGHLMPPFILFASCRLMRGSLPASTLAALLASMVWNFDAMTRWAWWVGMISYAMAAALIPLAYALFHRYVEEGKLRHALLLWVVLPVMHLIHPFAFIVLVVPMAVIYVRALRKLRPMAHLLILGACAATLLANLYWLLVVFKFWKYITASEVYGLVYPWTIITDYLGLLSNTENQSLVGMRSGWRFLIWTLAVLAMLLWRRQKDSRFLPLAVSLSLLLLLSYLGRYVPVMRHIQPYRHIIPLTFLAAVPAAVYAGHLIEEFRREKLSPVVRNALIVLAVVALPHLIRDAIYFIPQLKPVIERPEPGLPNISDTLGFGSIGWPDQQQYRHGLPRGDYLGVREWVVKHDDGSGRFLVQWWVLGEFLAWSTKAQVIGGFRQINLQHGLANIFRIYYHKPPTEEYFRKYIKRYAVKYLIVSGGMSPIETHKDLLTGVDFIPPAHRIYMLDESPSWFEKGDGKVKVSLNRIEVSGASGAEIVLKYHYLESFVCRPGCRVERSPVPGDPVGFVKVGSPPKHFVIENGY